MNHDDFVTQAETFWTKFFPPPAKTETAGDATEANNPEEES